MCQSTIQQQQLSVSNDNFYINHGSSSVNAEKGGSIGIDMLTGATAGTILVAKERNKIIHLSISQTNTVQSAHPSNLFKYVNNLRYSNDSKDIITYIQLY